MLEKCSFIEMNIIPRSSQDLNQAVYGNTIKRY